MDTVLRAVFDSFINLGWGVHGKLGNFYVAGLIKLENNGAYLYTDFAESALTEFNNRYFHDSYPLTALPIFLPNSMQASISS